MRPPTTAWQRTQRRKQAEWKQRTDELRDEERRPGQWNGRNVEYILPAASAEKNVWSAVRGPVLAHFAAQDIAWHQEGARGYGDRDGRGPSPHLLSSQVACVNFWWGLSLSPKALTAALGSILPAVLRVVSPVTGGPLVDPEWIGLRNHLGEREPRRRGDRTTSADLLLAYEDDTGARHGVLVESKFTESYASGQLVDGETGARRRADIYRPAFDADWSPIRRELCPPLEELIVEPFYQHLRQQLLAAAMERYADVELGFETVTVLHASPRANESFHETVTVPALQDRGDTVAEVWRSLLVQPDRYRCVAYEDLFAAAVSANDPTADAWIRYQRERYRWEDPPPRKRRGYSSGVFARGLHPAFLGDLTSGVGQPIVSACIEHGLDLRLRDDYVNVYDAGRALAKIERRRRSGLVKLSVHRKYIVGTPLSDVVHRKSGDYREFRLDADSAAAWIASLPSLRKRAAGYRGAEELVEEDFIRANRTGSPLVAIDRQIQIPGIQRRLDVAGVATDADGAHVFVAVELKQGLDNRIQHVTLQAHDYVMMLDPDGNGLREDVATAYRTVAEQMRALGFDAPEPERIEVGMPVVGLVVLANYNEASKLLGRASVKARVLERPVYLVSTPDDRQLAMPPMERWEKAEDFA